MPTSPPATPDALFVWVMHHFADRFGERAILKGGMELRLLDCPRSTTDIDYVFVPYDSKKDILGPIRTALGELEGAEVDVRLHSKMLRATVSLPGVAVQVEVNVAESCPSIPIATADFARTQGRPSQIVRAMALDAALAHKLAAWNERRLLRDLYDCYFLWTRAGSGLDLDVLDARLAKVESRIPTLKRTKSMTRAQLATALRQAADECDDKAIDQQLAPLLPDSELAGLVPRLRGTVTRLAEVLEG